MTRFHKHLAAAAALAAYVTVPAGAFAQPAMVIELTQTPCQFLESENGVNRGYRSVRQSDCESINAQTGDARLADAKVFTLTPGRYIFRVHNQNVPYPLGFWLRGEGLISRATLPSVSGGGLTQGTTKDYEITLKRGDYVYSCPLNPTPNYKLRVKG